MTCTGCLRINGVKNPEGEWFRCTVEQVKAAIIAVRTGQLNEENRSLDFKMRPEQEAAVEKTAAYFASWRKEKGNRNKPPHFLWNAKMRFGKTFAAYQLAKKMGWRKVLVLTFKPAVQSAWEEDLKCHVDFKGWQFISPGGLTYEEADKKKPFVCFGSFQDYLGRNPSTGGIKTKNEWVHTTNWDCVILDEYHYGAWRENAKELFEAEDKKEVEFGEGRRHRGLRRRHHADHDGRLSLPVRHAVPGHRIRRVHRGANLQLDLFRRTAGQAGLERRRTTPTPRCRGWCC